MVTATIAIELMSNHFEWMQMVAYKLSGAILTGVSTLFTLGMQVT